jgi:hypothetical protein
MTSAIGEFSTKAAHQEAQSGQKDTYESSKMKDGWEREDGRDPMPLLHPNHLELVFETRRLVEDQIHRGLQIHQRLDMLFTAYSNTSPGRQCPMCAQPFVLQAKAGINGGDVEPTG